MPANGAQPPIPVPLEGKVTTAEVEANGTRLVSRTSSASPGSVIVRQAGGISTIFNDEWWVYVAVGAVMSMRLPRHSTAASYMTIYSSSNYTRMYIPYALPLLNSFALNGVSGCTPKR